MHARGGTTRPRTFVYDHANQPVSATGSGLNAAWTYDGNLKRVKEVKNGKTVYTLYSRVTGGLVYRDEATDNRRTDYAELFSLTAFAVGRAARRCG